MAFKQPDSVITGCDPPVSARDDRVETRGFLAAVGLANRDGQGFQGADNSVVRSLKHPHGFSRDKNRGMDDRLVQGSDSRPHPDNAGN